MTTDLVTNDQHIIDSVKDWIDNVVIGLNFCPFAKKEMQQETVSYLVSHNLNINESLEQLIEQLCVLDQHTEIQTSLLIFSKGFIAFEEYLELVEYASGIIEQGGYSGIYQLATFHPDYCFAGEAQDDPANYTNRSPYPILHILRESSIEQVLKRYPDPQNIPDNNIAKARAMGSEKLKSMLQKKTT
ncbi:DUF1415 domain-containing protein [Paraglaciecola aquimarina]|uniref:DUF1415 domain-containing protein n=1 Tax=Paraglaciecola aquimarina TaxID=1235557 RepID=A0ABU3SWK7_9ALTE|nr:DUF1415 domain-containing protein [Paraglaciecola aquimarina]MDU0354396.1 DUF1415 domain-containing protein [Paraglaciecola aquimarina]